MVPEFLAGFESGASYSAGWSFVDARRLLETGDRPSPPRWHRIYVGHPLRLVATPALVFPHRVAHRAALGFASPRLRSTGPAFANGDYRGSAPLFAISAARTQSELRVSGSLAAPCVGVRTITSRGYPRGMHNDFLLANAPCVSAGFSCVSKSLNEDASEDRASARYMDTTKNLEKYEKMLQTALAEAREGLDEGGIPIGAALFTLEGTLLGKGHNRRVQEGDPSAHGETDAFRKAGRQRTYRDKIMVTTLAPCWYCSGLIRQFGIGTVIVGESINFQGGIAWLRENGVEVTDLNSQECIQLLAKYVNAHSEVWKEDIGEE